MFRGKEIIQITYFVNKPIIKIDLKNKKLIFTIIYYFIIYSPHFNKIFYYNKFYYLVIN